MAGSKIKTVARAAAWRRRSASDCPTSLFRAIREQMAVIMRTILSLLFVLVMVAIPEGSTVAQPSPQLPRIGVLTPGALGGLSILDSRPGYAALLSGLRELGYVQGRNIIVEFRRAEGKLDLLPGLAAELVRLKVAAIVANGPEAIKPAIKATKTIPIVMVGGGDPVGLEFVESLSLPGGNVTGLSSFGGEKMRGKQMEILKDAIPSLTRVALLNSREMKRSEERRVGKECRL